MAEIKKAALDELLRRKLNAGGAKAEACHLEIVYLPVLKRANPIREKHC